VTAMHGKTIKRNTQKKKKCEKKKKKKNKNRESRLPDGNGVLRGFLTLFIKKSPQTHLRQTICRSSPQTAPTSGKGMNCREPDQN
jgi:hypothetical protein